MFVCRIVYIHKPINCLTCFEFVALRFCCGTLCYILVIDVLHLWVGRRGWAYDADEKRKESLSVQLKQTCPVLISHMRNGTVHYRRLFSFLPKLNFYPTSKSHWNHSGYLWQAIISYLFSFDFFCGRCRPTLAFASVIIRAFASVWYNKRALMF